MGRSFGRQIVGRYGGARYFTHVQALDNRGRKGEGMEPEVAIKEHLMLQKLSHGWMCWKDDGSHEFGSTISCEPLLGMQLMAHYASIAWILE